MQSNIIISIHRSESELAAILPKWLVIFESNPEHQYFHHPVWYLALQTTLCEGNMAICLLEDEAGPLAVLPFVHSSPSIGKAILSSPIHDHVSLTDWILDDRATIENIVRVLPDIISALNLPGWSTIRSLSVPETSNTLRAIDIGESSDEVEATNQDNGFVCKSNMGEYQRRTRQIRESFWFNCLAVNEHLRSKLKGNLRRRRKKAAQQGEVSFESVSEPSKLELAFQEFLEIEASGWKGKKGVGTAISNHPLLRDFYTKLLQSEIPGLAAEINLLRIGDKVVAAQFVLNTKSVTNILKPAYDESYADVSPGLLLMEDVLNHCATETEMKSANLVTSPLWAEPWHPKKIRVFHSTMYNNNASGSAHAAIDAAKDFIRKIRSPKV